jgi:hypothetical protein
MWLFVQPHKCSTWALSSLLPGFVPPIEICCHPNGIKILGVPFGSISFAFFFARGSKWGCLTCRRVPNIRGISRWCLVSFLDVSPRDLFFCFVGSPPFRFLESSYRFLFYFNGNFWEAFGCKPIWMLQSLSCLSTCGFPHF